MENADNPMSMATTETSTENAPTDDAREELQDAVPKAAATMTDLLDAEDDKIRLRAAEAILDRAGITKAKATARTKAKREVGGEQRSDPLDHLTR